MKTDFIWSAYNRRHFEIVREQAGSFTVEQAIRDILIQEDISIVKYLELCESAKMLPF